MKYELNDRWLNIDVDSLFVDKIQDFFDYYIPSKKNQHLLIQNKNILLDGNPVKRDDYISGLKLNLNIYPNNHNYKKINNKIDVLYEDEILLIVNKPKDILVHSDGYEITLNQIVDSYVVDKNYIDVKPIHRLDKETSGLMIYSKSSIFQPLLDKYITEKKIRRNYLAFVEGIIEEGKSFVINKEIGKDRHNSNKYIIYDNGQKAITRIKCLKNNKKKNYSVLLCSLDTGRTHQIRVHLSSIGFPIINDELYGNKSDLCLRMGLFSYEIMMFHPLIEDNIVIEGKLPNDLNRLYEGSI